MNKAIWLVLASLVFVGCKKDGAKQHFMDGGQLPTDSQQQQPTDIHMPEPGQK